MNKKLIIIFFLAFLLRLISLNQSLWLDEATTARVATQYSYLGMLAKFSPFDFHPPLYYWLIKFWTMIFGFSEISLRLPSITFSLIAGYFVYLIGKSIKDQNTGIWAAVFFLFNPLVVYYSQEARMYMTATFLLSGATYFFILNIPTSPAKGGVRGASKNQILFNIFILLSLFSFYGAIFLVAAFMIYYFYKKQYQELFISLFVLLIYFLTISPLLFQQLTNAKVSLSMIKNWSLVLGKANLKNLLLIPMKFSMGRIDFYPKWFYYLIAGGWTGFVLYQISPLPPQKAGFEGQAKIKNILYFLFIGPLVLGFIISFVSPLLQYFRFIYLIPILAVILSFQLSTKVKQITLGGFLVFSLVYLLLPQFHREDWKNLAKYFPKNSTVYMIKSSSDPLTYYRKDLKIIDLAGLGNLPPLRKIFVVPYTAEIYGLDYQKKLTDKKYMLVNKQSYTDVYLEEWQLPR